MDPRETEGYLPAEELRFKMRGMDWHCLDDVSGEDDDKEIWENEEPPTV